MSNDIAKLDEAKPSEVENSVLTSEGWIKISNINPQHVLKIGNLLFECVLESPADTAFIEVNSLKFVKRDV
jgi:hypothetical protein